MLRKSVNAVLFGAVPSNAKCVITEGKNIFVIKIIDDDAHKTKEKINKKTFNLFFLPPGHGICGTRSRYNSKINRLQSRKKKQMKKRKLLFTKIFLRILQTVSEVKKHFKLNNQ